MALFRAFTLGHMLEEKLHIPFTTSLLKDDNSKMFPYYFVADETFPMKVNLIRTYSRKMLTKNVNLIPEVYRLCIWYTKC
jgi:hypothetical protein